MKAQKDLSTVGHHYISDTRAQSSKTRKQENLPDDALRAADANVVVQSTLTPQRQAERNAVSVPCRLYEFMK